MYHRNVVRIFVCVLVTLTKEEVLIYFLFLGQCGEEAVSV